VVGEGEHERSLGDAADHVGPLLGRAEVGDQARGQDRLEVRLGREHASDLLGDDRDLHRSGAEATVLLGERQAQRADLGQLAPHVLGEARVGLGDLATGLRRVVALAQQAADGVAQRGLLGVEGEVHGCLTVPGWSWR
jgi:hypothetical protein